MKYKLVIINFLNKSNQKEDKFNQKLKEKTNISKNKKINKERKKHTNKRKWQQN